MKVKLLLTVSLIFLSANAMACLGLVQGREVIVQLKAYSSIVLVLFMFGLAAVITYLNWKYIWLPVALLLSVLISYSHLFNPVEIASVSCQIMKEEVANVTLLLGTVILVFLVKLSIELHNEKRKNT